MLAAEDYQEVNRKYRLGVSYAWVFPLYLLQGNGQRPQFDWCADLISIFTGVEGHFPAVYHGVRLGGGGGEIVMLRQG